MIRNRFLRGAAVVSSLAMLTVIAACTGDDTSNKAASDGGTSDGGVQDSSSGDSSSLADAPSATCSSPGQATPGPADTHCTGSDGGPIVQPTDPASCHPDAAAPDGGDMGCPYGDTMFGMSGDDDDCKYHVVWTSGAICEGSGGVPFKVVVTKKADGSPLTGANAIAEVFTTTPGDAGCDDQSTHPGPNSGVQLTENPPGTYTGNVQFDQAGQWTLRFHFREDCADTLETSPHGHAAFHVTVP